MILTNYEVCQANNKSRKLRRTGNIAGMEDGGSAFKMVSAKSIGKRALGVDRKTVLEWILRCQCDELA